MKCNAIVAHETGGPEVLKWEQIEIPAPSADQALIRHTGIGMNFIDVYFRTGLYPAPTMPICPGMEGAGIVEQIGDDVTEVSVGDRVAYAGMPVGAYSEYRVIPSHRLIVIPEGISDETAASMMLKGMTVEYLLERTYRVSPGDIILLHAAAGGIGLIASQWAKARGATVIGTVGSEEKSELAQAHGCDHTIVYTKENFVDRVKDITKGAGVPVVYDSVGKDTLLDSIECLAPRGILVNFGQSSGKLENFDLGALAKGSFYVTRPSLMTYTASRTDLETSANTLFDLVLNEKVKIPINNRYKLKDAAQAHRDLEGRRTTGTTLFTL
jgi:NADPH2:quinone reductase